MKRTLAIALVAIALVALAVAPAFAEGYNGAWGSTGAYTRASGYVSGPHGDYTTTTNKCQDCHSTHYAAGSFMLLRANSREAACDYCHGGGGGSTVNIMMDNDYRTGAFTQTDMSSVAVTQTGTGNGTGHTLGYKGNAPADTYPAYSDSEGLACFDCHTPHGNSARVLATFANPGHALFDVGIDANGWLSRDYVVSVSAGPTKIFTSNAVSSQIGTVAAAFDNGTGGSFTVTGSRPLTAAEADLVFESTTYNGTKVWVLSKPKTHTVMNGVFFGFTPQEKNLVANVKSDGIRGAANGTVEEKPIFPSGRWLLIVNPDAEGGIADTVVSSNSTTAGVGGVPNKYAIQWATKANGGDPLGPADKLYGGDQNADNDRGVPTAPNGINMVSEFCVDCHDGTAGASTQPALVWEPLGVSGSTEGTYSVAFSHDTQPRHCYRQMWLGTDTDGTNDNEGPHCRNCHSGASTCNQCHGGGTGRTGYENQFYSTSVIGTTTPYATAFRGQPYLHTSAVTGLNSKCLDGGFSFPHRTLGKDMLKDELYGIDFDGTPISAGATRTANSTFDAVAGNYPYVWASSNTSETTVAAPFGAPNESGEQLKGMKTENLDSVCIDCHGDATYYNGDNLAYSYNGAGNEWELLLKGLP